MLVYVVGDARGVGKVQDVAGDAFETVKNYMSIDISSADISTTIFTKNCIQSILQFRIKP